MNPLHETKINSYTKILLKRHLPKNIQNLFDEFYLTYKSQTNFIFVNF